MIHLVDEEDEGSAFTGVFAATACCSWRTHERIRRVSATSARTLAAAFVVSALAGDDGASCDGCRESAARPALGFWRWAEGRDEAVTEVCTEEGEMVTADEASESAIASSKEAADASTRYLRLMAS
jgi:hypothetical protein